MNPERSSPGRWTFFDPVHPRFAVGKPTRTLRALRCGGRVPQKISNAPLPKTLFRIPTARIFFLLHSPLILRPRVCGRDTWPRYGDFSGVPVRTVKRPNVSFPLLSFRPGRSRAFLEARIVDSSGHPADAAERPPGKLFEHRRCEFFPGSVARTCRVEECTACRRRAEARPASLTPTRSCSVAWS
jgi:hypothetical protein